MVEINTTNNLSSIVSQYRKIDSLSRDRVFQWDIYRDINIFYWTDIWPSWIPNAFTVVEQKYIIIVSQDCDLESDNRCRKLIRHNPNSSNDKIISNFLAIPWHLLWSFCQWTHIAWLTRNPNDIIDSSKKKKIKDNNEYERYHYLKECREHCLPELVFDFKHYFTIPSDYFYKNFMRKYVCSLNEIYRERFSQRYTQYLWRIWLP